MNVGELRAALEGLPDEIPVVTMSRNAVISMVTKANRMPVMDYFDPKLEGPVFRVCLVIES